MKKIISLLLALVFTFVWLTSCTTAPDSDFTESSTVASTSETMASDTTASQDTSTTQHSNSSDEKVNIISLQNWSAPLSYGWYFYPEYEKENSQDFAFEITIENSEIVNMEDTEFANMKDNEMFASENGVLFELMPQTITCKITNQTGEDFFQLGSAYLECYKADALSGIGGWVRVPYVNEDDNAKGKIFYENGEGTYTLDIGKYKKSMKEDVAYRYFEAGFYRVVFYLNDGPHYVRFMILYTPE